MLFELTVLVHSVHHVSAIAASHAVAVVGGERVRRHPLPAVGVPTAVATGAHLPTPRGLSHRRARRRTSDETHARLT